MEKLNEISDAKKIEEIGGLLLEGTYTKKLKNPFDKFDRYESPNEKIALPFIERAAMAGQTTSQVRLAKLFLSDSNGFKPFVSSAAKWLEKASIAGDNWARVELGKLYVKGEGVIQDFSAAVELFEQAATSQAQKVKLDGSNVEVDVQSLVTFEAQYLMGIANERGLGVQKDLVKAHAWYNIAATNGFEKAVPARSALTRQLTADQLAEAQALAKNWKPGSSSSLTGMPVEKSGAIAAAGGPVVKVGTGTLFVVSKAGHAVTNQHVAGGCRELRVQGRDGLATLLNEDKINDLALLQIQGAVTSTATITAEPGKLRQGDEIAAFGFPLKSVLSSGGNLTPGVVSALTGIGNNINQIQITAPIQPGSSGSPVLNKKGEVIGVVSMKLNDAKMVEATGQIGQNINFAVSGQTLKTFLDTHKVTYNTGGYFLRDRSMADLADEARKWTYVVECWK